MRPAGELPAAIVEAMAAYATRSSAHGRLEDAMRRWSIEEINRLATLIDNEQLTPAKVEAMLSGRYRLEAT